MLSFAHPVDSTAYSFVKLPMSNIPCKTHFSLLLDNRSNGALMALTEVHITGSPEVIGNRSVLLQKKN